MTRSTIRSSLRSSALQDSVLPTVSCRKTVVDTGVLKLKETVTKGELLFFAFNVNDRLIKFKFDKVYGCRHSLNDDIMRVTDVMIDGKCALVCS